MHVQMLPRFERTPKTKGLRITAAVTRPFLPPVFRGARKKSGKAI